MQKKKFNFDACLDHYNFNDKYKEVNLRFIVSMKDKQVLRLLKEHINNNKIHFNITVS